MTTTAPIIKKYDIPVEDKPTRGIPLLAPPDPSRLIPNTIPAPTFDPIRVPEKVGVGVRE